MTPRSVRKAGGFTILELLLAVAIGVIIIGGAYTVYDASQSTARKDERQSDLQQNARSAFDMLLWQLRLAGYYQDTNPDVGLNGYSAKPNRIIIGTPTVLVVRGDVQLTGIPGFVDTLFAVQQPGPGQVCNPPAPCPNCAPPPCLVSGTNVYTVAAAQTVAGYNISSLTFAYFDANGVTLTATPIGLDGVGPGAFVNGVVPSPLPNPLPVPNAPDPLAGSAARDAVRTVLVNMTAVDPNFVAGTGADASQNLNQVTLQAYVRLRNAL